MKISVVVPIYKKPKYFADIARKILNNDYGDNEIIAVIDGEMTPDIKEALEPLDGKIKTVYPRIHTGKALALNNAVKNLTTDIILFFDNDIQLPDDPQFLSRLAKEMETHDIVEMPKEVIVESLYSAMIGYEYLSFAMACLTFSAVGKRSPGVIGSAFAVKKELFDKMEGFRQVVHEDGDFGARAFRLHARYSYNTKLKVKTTMPNKFSDWYKQRKRWTLINVLWFKDNFLYLVLKAFKHPSLLPSLFFIILPSLLSLFVFIIFNHFHLTFIIPVAFVVTQPLQFFSGVFLWFTHYSTVTRDLWGVLIGFGISTLIFLVFSLFIKFRFNVFEYILYYFFYLPLLVVINIVMFILLLGKRDIDLDWKV
jgi:cellulose synthase/poly-beta-1,6-N-acetylglucosamine synthase-like glycosyltransferase